MECITQYVGVDISKLTFDVSLQEQGSYRHHLFSNDAPGFRDFLKKLRQQPFSPQVVMEASGPYYLQLAGFLNAHGVAVSVVNPLVIRRFCQMRLSRTKTDKKDAYMIALYGNAEHPPLWEPDAAYVQELRQMQTATEGLNKSRMQMGRQIESFTCGPVMSKDAVKALKSAIREIDKQLAVLEEEMTALMERYHASMFRHLLSIPGVGKKTAMLLLVVTGAFTKFSNARQVSSYFGLSPRIYESGTSVHGRACITKMGMSRIRAMLYLCAWSAKRCNKACKELYERPVAKGKSGRLALIAVANKLIKQAFAIATKQTFYQQA